jgi:hypothetical protein
MIRDSGFGIRGPGFRIQDSGFRFHVSGFRIQDSGFRIQDCDPSQKVLYHRTFICTPPELPIHHHPTLYLSPSLSGKEACEYAFFVLGCVRVGVVDWLVLSSLCCKNKREMGLPWEPIMHFFVFHPNYPSTTSPQSLSFSLSVGVRSKRVCIF